MKKEHTPGALKAAKSMLRCQDETDGHVLYLMLEDTSREVDRWVSPTSAYNTRNKLRDEMATIIDRETSTLEVMDRLERLVAECREVGAPALGLLEMCETTLQKARGTHAAQG